MNADGPSQASSAQWSARSEQTRLRPYFIPARSATNSAVLQPLPQF